MYDTGGSRVDRSKWKFGLKEAKRMVFVVSLTGHNQCVPEDKKDVGNGFLYALEHTATLADLVSVERTQ